jgi:hypothetical protein
MSHAYYLSYDKAMGYSGGMSPPPRDRHIPDLVSATEAANLLGVTRQAVQLMANNAQLLGAKVGNTWVFRRVVVEREAAERTGKMSTEVEVDG